MTWPCFYCTYDNEDDSATQCSICGMPGNRKFKKATAKSSRSNGDKKSNGKKQQEPIIDLASTQTIIAAGILTGKSIGDSTGTRQRKRTAAQISSSTIDLTTPETITSAFTSKRKRNFSQSITTNTSKKKTERNSTIDSSLAIRKLSQRPKLPKQQQQQQQRQSTISFSSASREKKSYFSHGHIFEHKALSLDHRIRQDGNYKTKMQTVLQNVFGLKSLRRNLQPAAIACAMEGKSQMVVMATGGGKSLCYQLPACLLGGVTIVISPLLALMKDQTEALNEKGIPASCINSSQTEKQNKGILEKLVPALFPKSLSKGNSTNNNAPPAVLFYVTPESIQTERMRAVLKQLYKEDRLAMFAVDEAHCLSTWVSKKFRQRSSLMRKFFPCLMQIINPLTFAVFCLSFLSQFNHAVIGKNNQTSKIFKGARFSIQLSPAKLLEIDLSENPLHGTDSHRNTKGH